MWPTQATWLVVITTIMEAVFTCIYSIEALAKIFAGGFVRAPSPPHTHTRVAPYTPRSLVHFTAGFNKHHKGGGAYLIVIRALRSRNRTGRLA